MVLILEGNLDNGMDLLTWNSLFALFKAFVYIDSSVKFVIFFLIDRLYFLYTFTTCYDLPSSIRTMARAELINHLIRKPWVEGQMCRKTVISIRCQFRPKEIKVSKPRRVGQRPSNKLFWALAYPRIPPPAKSLTLLYVTRLYNFNNSNKDVNN